MVYQLTYQPICFKNEVTDIFPVCLSRPIFPFDVLTIFKVINIRAKDITTKIKERHVLDNQHFSVMEDKEFRQFRHHLEEHT